MIIGSNDTKDSHAMLSNFDQYTSKRLELAICVSGNTPSSLSTLRKRPATKTPIIAPVDEIPTSPKLSASPILLSFLMAETPAANASMKGTVTAPVVAPDASNAMARKSNEENSDKIKIKPYAPVNTYLSR